MEREVLVYTGPAESPLRVGRLWARQRKGQESATSEYSRQWIQHPAHFSLEPALALGPGPHHTAQGKALFGALGDSAPDRWGRLLMRRAERRRAAKEKTQPRTLAEIDFLLGVDDETRQGALRFATAEGGPFLADGTGSRVPPLVDLPKLLSAAERVGGEKETAEDMQLLLAPGSSLGGARPKASVRDRDGSLAIAKFPQKSDETDAVRWEAVALKLAAAAGIAVAQSRVENIGKKRALIVKRFDREGARRIPFLSAMSMLGASDHETHSYMEIADAIRQHGAAPKEDLAQLWRRIVFNILSSNTDDHLRNHAFLWVGTNGWRLSPAYDLNPAPADVKPRILSTLIDRNDGTASLDLALQVAPYFRLSAHEARRVAAEVAKAVKPWRRVASAAGIRKAEIDTMASAFEHEDLAIALKSAA